jgi:hypothetical protein
MPQALSPLPGQERDFDPAPLRPFWEKRLSVKSSEEIASTSVVNDGLAKSGSRCLVLIEDLARNDG